MAQSYIPVPTPKQGEHISVMGRNLVVRDYNGDTLAVTNVYSEGGSRGDVVVMPRETARELFQFMIDNGIFDLADFRKDEPTFEDFDNIASDDVVDETSDGMVGAIFATEDSDEESKGEDAPVDVEDSQEFENLTHYKQLPERDYQSEENSDE